MDRPREDRREICRTSFDKGIYLRISTVRFKLCNRGKIPLLFFWSDKIYSWLLSSPVLSLLFLLLLQFFYCFLIFLVYILLSTLTVEKCVLSTFKIFFLPISFLLLKLLRKNLQKLN